MAQKFTSVARSEIPSWKYVRLSLTFLFSFAAKFVGWNAKIFPLMKMEDLEIFASLSGLPLGDRS